MPIGQNCHCCRSHREPSWFPWPPPLFGVFTTITLYFDDQMQWVVMPVVHHHNKMGRVDTLLRAIAVWDFQSEAAIAGVPFDLSMGLNPAAAVNNLLCGLTIFIKLPVS